MSEVTGTYLGPSAHVDVYAYGYQEAARDAVSWAMKTYGWNGAKWGKAIIIQESPDPEDHPTLFRLLVSEHKIDDAAPDVSSIIYEQID